MPDKYERSVTSYLRLNGYFTVPNFIVHAADDPGRIMADHVGNYTETDIIGVRMPYSREMTGRLHIANHELLIDGPDGKIDVVVAEVKSGKDNRPNPVWRGANAKRAACYIARFVGLHGDDETHVVGDALATTFRYENDRSRFRYIVFAVGPNAHYQKKGVSYITFEQAISFIVQVRGQSWIDSNIGVASSHHQWDELLVDILSVANKLKEPEQDRIQEIKSMLAT